MNSRICFLLVITALLQSCSEGGIGGTGGINEPPGGDPSLALLLPPESDLAFRDYIIAGLEQWYGLADDSSEVRDNLVQGNPISTVITQNDAVNSSLESADAANLSSAIGNADFTQTNVLVQGVDELDPVKYDGEYMYLAQNDRIQILKTNSSGQAAIEIDTLKLVDSDTNSQIKGLYLLKNDNDSILSTIRTNASHIWTLDFFAPFNWNGETVIDIVDIRDPETAFRTEEITIDGSYVNSRRIGNILYLITRFTPGVDGLIPFATSEADQQTNRTLLADIGVDDLLPKIKFQGDPSQPLLTSQQCLIPAVEEATESDQVNYPTLTTITAIDLHNPLDISAICIAEGIWGMHLSEDAIYLAGIDHSRSVQNDFYTETVIHKFSTNNGNPVYVASGRVPGTFWGDPAFLMGEHEGNLTVITTADSGDPENRFQHRLTILGESTEEFVLEVLGQIPNTNRNAVIGKPNEQIFASRIVGNRAFVVTFQQIDPVYVIDLSDPSDPAILGELEIPGFSSYLQPVSENLLLGVGKDTRTESGFPFFQGMNIRLFDVSDPANLQVLSDLKIGRRGTDSPVFWDPHSFTFLEGNSERPHRVAIPIRVHGAHLPDDSNLSAATYFGWTENALYLFEINTDGNTPELSYVGKMVAEDFDTGQRFQPGCCNWNSRSFLNAGDIHYLNKSRLFSATWGEPGNAQNIFIPSIFVDEAGDVCTAEVRNGLIVDLFDRETRDFLSCADAIAIDGDFQAELKTSCDMAGEDSKGLFERAGIYDMSVDKDGFLPFSTSDVHVQTDECHVSTTYVSIYLQRQQP